MDMWSIGCLFYELCALKMPFDGENIYDLMDNIMANDYKPVPDHYSGEVTQLIKILLKIDPVERPTCADILKLAAIEKVTGYLKTKFKPVFAIEKYDYDLSAVSILSEMSFTSFETKIRKIVRQDSPRLLKPKKKPKPKPKPVIVKPKTPPKPKTPSPPPPPPPPKPRQKPKRYFQNIDRGKLEKMFYS